jgi:hypothetical protein
VIPRGDFLGACQHAGLLTFLYVFSHAGMLACQLVSFFICFSHAGMLACQLVSFFADSLSAKKRRATAISTPFPAPIGGTTMS